MFNVGVELGQLIFVVVALAVRALLIRLPVTRRAGAIRNALCDRRSRDVLGDRESGSVLLGRPRLPLLHIAAPALIPHKSACDRDH